MNNIYLAIESLERGKSDVRFAMELLSKIQVQSAEIVESAEKCKQLRSKIDKAIQTLEALTMK